MIACLDDEELSHVLLCWPRLLGALLNPRPFSHGSKHLSWYKLALAPVVPPHV
jgi:hypothetical protein